MTAIAFTPEPAHALDVEDRLQFLRRFNLAMGMLHLLSGGVMLALANDFSIQTSSFVLGGPPGTPVADGETVALFSVRIAWGTVAFLFLSAFFHFLIASPWGSRRYADELRAGRNRFRWVEYSMSATLMILMIALIVGITDIAALIAIAVANASMILFGWLMEMVNPPGRPVWWTPFWFGCIAGSAPWIALVAQLWISADEGASPPSFVYGILVSIFVLFNCFAVNQFLQYRGVGRWRDYLFGETTYIVLSLTAKSALAWQIFANTLI
jgi:Heliorhodopsin